MMGCPSSPSSLPCLPGGGKPPLPSAAPPADSAAPLHKLALATGGTEKSWYRCLFPFGVVALVIGLAATCITFTINGPQMGIAKAVSVASLVFGGGLLGGALLCWRATRRRRRRQRQQQQQQQQEEGAPPGGPLEPGGAL